jgi:RNA helicase (UPF2 interacting domain)
MKEVQLHKAGPLGDSVLECYATGNRNVFALGFVPIANENTVVLLARDTPPHAPGIKDLELDVTTWQPLIGETRQCSRPFVLATACCTVSRMLSQCILGTIIWI